MKISNITIDCSQIPSINKKEYVINNLQHYLSDIYIYVTPKLRTIFLLNVDTVWNGGDNFCYKHHNLVNIQKETEKECLICGENVVYLDIIE